MADYRFNGGKNFHVIFSGNDLSVTYEKNGSEYQTDITDGEMQEERRTGFYDESVVLSDGRKLIRTRDKLSIN